MGEVYRAYDPDLERDVALKVLAGAAAQNADRVRRLIQEAKAASALHHPNVAHVYEIGSHDGVPFIAMELVEGQTLRDRAAGKPMPIDEVLDLGVQVASALAAAHKAAIVHRDVKPENVMITPDGYAKVLDFGLAKFRELRSDEAATLLMTQPGMAVGTLGYMSPEQLGAGEVTAAADVFSLGVVLYEIVSGRRPFSGSTQAEVISSILHRMPRALGELRGEIPPKLAAVISKCLAKEAGDRYPTANELLEELRVISRDRIQAVPLASKQPRLSRRSAVAGLAVLLVAAAGGVGWWFVRASRIRRAEDSVKVAEGLLAQRKLPEAYEMATVAAAVLPGSQRLRDLVAESSDELTVESAPPGAAVFVQRFRGPAARVAMGTTPLTVRVPRADFVVSVEKPGYAPVARSLSMTPFFIPGGRVPSPSPKLTVNLMEAAKVPAEMVFVGGGECRLGGSVPASDRRVTLRDFLLDRYEVSNRDFEEFVRAGGYRRRELWKVPFADGGKSLAFEAAMARFHDTTGLPGPRSWVGGAPPPGRENHPVTDVTWYEAAAFAEWKGKKLPTIYQWEKAARYPASPTAGMNFPWGVVGEGIDAAERSNFLGKGTLPGDAMPFGMSIWGAQHLAGNVAEWCRNAKGPGFAFRGGSWNDPVYAFHRTGGYPALYSGATLGFRCAKSLGPDAGDEGDFAIAASDVIPTFHPVDDGTFAELRKKYEYAKTPLNARVVETVDTPDWRRETIVYDVGGTAVTAYLYLPLGFKRPLQVIHSAPAGDVDGGFRTLTSSVESSLAPFIRGGRAVFSVLLEGYVGRPSLSSERPDTRSTEYVDYVVKRVTELRRGLDYLETRPDLERSRIAFVARSAGSWTGLILAAVEPRYRSVMLTGTGVKPQEVSDAAAANRINFAPQITVPKLMLHGRYDEDVPFKSEAEPLFGLLREPKRIEVYEGSHIPPMSVAIPVTTKWLDETLGPVGQ